MFTFYFQTQKAKADIEYSQLCTRLLDNLLLADIGSVYQEVQ